jgi:catechol 2,3-dioxygenase-like lactoylglutathione lyase family enzyme
VSTLSRLVLSALLGLVLALAHAAPAAAQLPAPNAAGVRMGHLHYTVQDVAAHRKFWTALGGEPLPDAVTGTQAFAFPGVIVVLTPGGSTGGTDGSILNHVAFRVQSFAAVEAAGFTVARLAQFPGVGSVTTPEGERIELFENTATNLTFTPDAGYAGAAADIAAAGRHNRPLELPIAFHHIHLYVPDGEVADAKAWYARMFGGVPGKRSNYDAVDLPGVNFNFSAGPRPTVPTAGRMLDHISIMSTNLDRLCPALMQKGATFVVPCTRPASGPAYARIVDPWGTSIELTDGVWATSLR